MKKVFLLLLAITAFTFTACQTDSNTANKKNAEETTQTKKPKHKVVNMMGKVPPQLFVQKLDDPNTVIVDLRTPAELKETGYIKGAVNIDYQEAGWQEKFANYKKDQTLLIYCAAGGRSGEAFTELQKMGFTRIFDLQGGINSWLKEGMPTEKL